MTEHTYVRWWRVGDATRMSLIHIRNDRGTHDELGKTACGKTFKVDRIVEPPYHELSNEDGTPDEEDRMCRSCMIAVGYWV